MAVLDEMPFSTSAYLADTQHLSLPQHGAYLLLLMTMWRAGGWIDDDERRLAIICKLSVPKWRLISTDVLQLLVRNDGKLSQKRLLSEVEKKLKRVEQNRSSGGAGGRAKSLKKNAGTMASATVLLETEPEPPLSLLDIGVGREIPEKESKGVEPPTKHRRSTRSVISADWLVSDHGQQFAKALGFDQVRIDAMRNGFVRYYRRTGKTIADWEAAWEGWCDNEVKFSRERAAVSPHGSGRGGRMTFADIARGVGDGRAD